MKYVFNNVPGLFLNCQVRTRLVAFKFAVGMFECVRYERGGQGK